MSAPHTRLSSLLTGPHVPRGAPQVRGGTRMAPASVAGKAPLRGTEGSLGPSPLSREHGRRGGRSRTISAPQRKDAELTSETPALVPLSTGTKVGTARLQTPRCTKHRH